MQTEEIKLLGGKFTCNAQMQSTIAELVTLLGSEDAVVDETVSNILYRNWYPRVYRKASTQVSEGGFPVTEESREKREGKDDKVVFESPMDHLKRFIDGNDENEAKLKGIFDSLCASEPLYVKGERTAGGGKLSDEAKKASASFFAAGPEAIRKAVAGIEANYPGYKVVLGAEGLPSEEGLARGIQSLGKYLKDKKEKEAKAELAGMLG